MVYLALVPVNPISRSFRSRLMLRLACRALVVPWTTTLVFLAPKMQNPCEARCLQAGAWREHKHPWRDSGTLNPKHPKPQYPKP